MDIAVGERGASGFVEADAALRAVIDLTVCHLQSRAEGSLDAEDAAAVEAAAADGDVRAVLEHQHAAGAGALPLGVAGGQTGYADAGAVQEGQNVGIAGNGGNGAGCRVISCCADAEVLHVPDDKLGTVVPVPPEIVLPAENAVVRGGAEVEQPGIDDNRPVRADGGEKLIRRPHAYLAAFRHLERRGSACVRLRIRVIGTVAHGLQRIGAEVIAVRSDGAEAALQVPGEGHRVREHVQLKAAAVRQRRILLE